MKLTKLRLIVFFLMIAIASFLRFYDLGTNPPSLTWDEAAWGYNAYSIGLDGRDEFGRFLPVDYLESFGDFKPPLYAYLTTLPVKIFGLTEFATRFPSALFGVATVFLTYFLVKQVFWKSKNAEYYALASSLFLAISPWHIVLSRAAFEANVSTFFIAAGVLLFLLAIQKNKWFLILSSVFLVLPFYTFNTGRIVSPILVIILTFMFRKELLKIRTTAVVSALVGFILLLPLIQFLFSPQASLRFREVNIFSDIEVVKRSNQEIANDNNAPWSKIIHNRRLIYAVSFLKHYLDHFKPTYLFIKGDGNPKFSTQHVGQMYIWDIVFLISGALFLFRRREGVWWLVPAWLLVAIIPAATARETPHALRTLAALPTFQIIVAYGFIQVVGLLKRYKSVVVSALLLLLFFNFVYFYRDYLFNYKYDYSGEWQYGYRESIDYVKSEQNKYDSIRITRALGRPYIYYLFYTKTAPQDFRKNAVIKRDVFGFVEVVSFGKYSFPEDLNAKDPRFKNVLYVGTPYNLPENIKIQKTFYLLNGKTALVAYTL